jgi:hypothetical protein
MKYSHPHLGGEDEERPEARPQRLNQLPEFAFPSTLFYTKKPLKTKFFWASCQIPVNLTENQMKNDCAFFKTW